MTVKPSITGSLCDSGESVAGGFVVPYKDLERKMANRLEYNQLQRNGDHKRARANNRVYRATHHELECARHRAYREKNQEKVRASSRAYSKAHLEVRRVSNQRRRARKLAAISTLTVAQWRAIRAAYKDRCAYCGKKPKRLTMDHVIPLFKNGTHTADNVVPACLSCNSTKHVGPPPTVPTLRLLL